MGSDQHLRYVNKRRVTPTPQPPAIRPNVLENLSANDVKTNVQGASAIITKTGKTIHILLNNVKSFFTEGNVLLITSVDSEAPVYLQFPTTAQAVQAEVRFKAIMNGGLVI